MENCKGLFQYSTECKQSEIQHEVEVGHDMSFLDTIPPIKDQEAFPIESNENKNCSSESNNLNLQSKSKRKRRGKRRNKAKNNLDWLHGLSKEEIEINAEIDERIYNGDYSSSDDENEINIPQVMSSLMKLESVVDGSDAKLVVEIEHSVRKVINQENESDSDESALDINFGRLNLNDDEGSEDSYDEIIKAQEDYFEQQFYDSD